MATTARSAWSYLKSSPNTTTSSTSSCRPGDSGQTRLDAEDVATRAAGFILRTGAAGAEAGASGSYRKIFHQISRLISRRICRLDNFPTGRGTLLRQVIPTTDTGDTRDGEKQQGTGRRHGRTRTDMGSGVAKGALARALTATMEGGTASAILPTTGVLLNSSGRPPAGKVQVMVFPRLGPKFSNSSDTATDAISLRIRRLPSSSSTINSKRLRGRR